MNYQYLHTEINGIYQDLKVIRPVPEMYRREVNRYAFITDAAEARLPGGYCYAPVPAEDRPPLLIFSRVEKKLNSTSLCFFTQCAAWEWNKVLLLDEFDSILRTPFLSEEQIDRLSSDSGAYRFGEDGVTKADDTELDIHPDAIRAILYGVTFGWRVSGAPVHIIVPKKEMDSYDRYVLRAVRKIYSYFTLGMKTHAGFASFIQPGKERQYPAVSLIFVPEEYADSKAIRLDGSTVGAYRQMSVSQGKNLDGFLDYLAGLSDPEQRRDFLAMVSREVEFDGDNTKTGQLDPTRYRNIGQGLALLAQQGSVEEQLPSWQEFSGTFRSMPGAVADMVWEKIDRELDADSFRPLVEKKAAACADLESLMDVLTGWRPLCRGREELTRVLWDCFASRMKTIGAQSNPDDTFRILKKHQAEISELWSGPETAELIGGYEQQCLQRVREKARGYLGTIADKSVKEIRKTGKTLASDADSHLRSLGCGEESIAPVLEEISAGTEALAVAGLKRDLEQAQARPTEDLTSAEEALADFQRILSELPAAGADPETDGLRTRAETAVEALEDKIRAFRTGLDALFGKMEGQDYFTCLELAEEWDQWLDDNGRETVRRELARRRPDSFDDYLAAFNGHYKQSGLSLRSALNCTDAVRKAMANDLRELRSAPVRVSLDSDLETLRKKCRRLQEQAGIVGADMPTLLVAADDKGEMRCSADFVERAAALAPTAEDLKNAGFLPLMQQLVRSAELKGKDLAPIHRIMTSCGEDSWKWLLAKAATGRIRGVSEEELDDYLASICSERVNDGGKTREKLVIKTLGEIAEKKKLAEPFRTFLHEKKKEAAEKGSSAKEKLKKSRILSIILSAVAVLAVAAAAVLGVKFSHTKKDVADLTERNDILQFQLDELRKAAEEPVEEPEEESAPSGHYHYRPVDHIQ